MKKNFLSLPAWLRFNVFYRAKLDIDSSKKTKTGKSFKRVHPYDANLISSENCANKHTLMLDLDIRHFYVESSTEGHGHLYLDTNLTYAELVEILTPLVKYGIVQQGIYDTLLERRFLALRLPGQLKGTCDDYDLETMKEFHNE